MRLFVAAELPHEVRLRLRGIQDELRSLPLPVRWVAPEGMHLTLKFIGEVGGDRRQPIEAALEGARHGIAPFRLEVRTVQALPERGTPRLIWMDVTGDDEAAAMLQSRIETALAGAGIPRERRPFRPHLTLGRVKSAPTGEWRRPLERMAGAEAGELMVEEYVLFESRLGPGGAAYVPLARFSLSAAGPR